MDETEKKKSRGFWGSKKIRTQIQAMVINKSLESEKLWGKKYPQDLVVGYTGKEAKGKKNQMKE